VAACVTFAGSVANPIHTGVHPNLLHLDPVGGLQVKAALYIDPLSMTMCLFITG